MVLMWKNIYKKGTESPLPKTKQYIQICISNRVAITAIESCEPFLKGQYVQCTC
jgi:hypothetical protein